MNHRIFTFAGVLCAGLLLAACSNTPKGKTEDLPILKEVFKSKEAKKVSDKRKANRAKIDRLRQGSAIDRLAALGLESDDQETRETLALLALEDANQRSKRWLLAALSFYNKGKDKIFEALASDALEMQLEATAISGGVNTPDGRAIEWRVIPNIALFGNPDLDGEIRDYAAPELGIQKGESRKPWLGFASAYLKSQAKLSEDALVVDGPHSTLVLDFAENMRSVKKLVERKRDATLHFQVSFRLVQIKKGAFPKLKMLKDIPMFRKLIGSELERIERMIKSKQGAQVISAPRLTILPGQLANVSVMNEIAYVKEFNQVVQNGAVLADPVVATVRDGVTVESRIAEVDEESVFAKFAFEVASVNRPIQVVETKILGNKAQIQIPDVSYSRDAITSRFEVDKTYLSAPMTMVSHNKDGDATLNELYVLFKIKRVKAKGDK